MFGIRSAYTAARFGLHRLVPRITIVYKSFSIGARREFHTTQGTMANLNVEIPTLKLNDGSNIPMVSAL